MATKNIAITEDAYNLLARFKRLNESFSQVIVEHFKKKKKLADYAGIWSDMPADDWIKLEGTISEARRGLHKSLSKRVEALK